MSENILKELGTQKIHEDTHIARAHIQSVIYESFEELNKVQFLGFLSILEREYELDLSELKAKGLAFFDEQALEKTVKKGVFVISKPPVKSKLIYIILLVIFLIGVAIFSLKSDFQTPSSEVKIEENIIITTKVKEEIVTTESNETNSSESNVSVMDANTTKELNTTIIPKEEKVVVVKEVLKSFSIRPKSRVWIGYIDRKNNKKYQDTIKRKLTLKKDKEWLIVLGHSHVSFDVNGKSKTFSAKGNLRLHYKDGKLSKISFEEFKKLNRGRKW